MPTTDGSSLNRALRWSERYTKVDMVYMAESGFWINLGSILVSLFSLALYIIFARTLSPETYGTYQYLLSAGALIGAFSLTGMNNAVTRAVAQGREGTLRSAVRAQLQWGVLPASISLMVALYYLSAHNGLLAAGFALTAIFMPVNNALNTYSSYLIGKKDFKRLFLYNLSINIFFYGGLILLALAGPGALALIAVNLVTQLVGLYLAYRTTVKKFHLPDTDDIETLQYGKHLSFMGVIGSVAQYADNILAFHFLGPVSLAVYSFATAVPDRAVGLLKFIPTALFPKLAEHDLAGARAAVSFKRIIWMLVLALIIAGVYALFAPAFFTLLFPRYTAAIAFSQVYGLSTFVLLGAVFSSALTAQKQIKQLYVLNTAAPILQLTLQVLGIILWGLWGLVFGRLISILFSVALSAGLLFLSQNSEKTISS